MLVLRLLRLLSLLLLSILLLHGLLSILLLHGLLSILLLPILLLNRHYGPGHVDNGHHASRGVAELVQARQLRHLSLLVTLLISLLLIILLISLLLIGHLSLR